MIKYDLTIESTLDKNIIKFNNTDTLIKGSVEYTSAEQAKSSPLAQELFYIPFVKKIFITANFIAIEKSSHIAWEDVQEEVKSQIESFLNKGGKIINENSKVNKLNVEVYAESTPNPNVMKFVSNKLLYQNEIEYKRDCELSESPLAKALFKFPYVKEVFIAENYISITKIEPIQWNQIFAELRVFIQQYISQGKPVVVGTPVIEDTHKKIKDQNFDQTSKKIISILDQYVKPAVVSDGGNIRFESYDPKTKQVNVTLQGACSGCPSSVITLKNGIETLLKEMIPDHINKVIAVNG